LQQRVRQFEHATLALGRALEHVTEMALEQRLERAVAQRDWRPGGGGRCGALALEPSRDRPR
jgi:hypothetical protein